MSVLKRSTYQYRCPSTFEGYRAVLRSARKDLFPYSAGICQKYFSRDLQRTAVTAVSSAFASVSCKGTYSVDHCDMALECLNKETQPVRISKSRLLSGGSSDRKSPAGILDSHGRADRSPSGRCDHDTAAGRGAHRRRPAAFVRDLTTPEGGVHTNGGATCDCRGRLDVSQLTAVGRAAGFGESGAHQR